MKLLSAFIVRLTELLEAEGRMLKRAIVRVALALMLVFVVGVLLISTLGLFGGSLYLVFAELLNPAASLAILGGVTLLLAVIGLLLTLVLRDGGR